jgi:small subunit ribosomal protein S8
MDTLANGLISLKNSEAVGKKECKVKPASKLFGELLKIMQGEGYVGDFEIVDDGKAGYYKIKLLGRINNCRVIKPRYPIQKTNFTRWEKRYLPAKDLGILILSTPKGVMSNKGARAANIGGRLLAYVY